ncbi:MAG: hypothetical protein L6246_00050 [Thermodesulfovibrionales bacterium]|nr:hypothetical protein [Nitrospinota bacterium]MBU4509707.1 hypothetical protein [bacterium]MCG2708706.1 hypothetical protein [Thermodesulfovibrionales bacterium]
MHQYEAVIKAMEGNGGYATLGYLYQNALKIRACEWKTKTPFATIRRIVQDERFFFKIRPGLWALKTYKDRLPSNILPTKEISKPKQEEFTHTYYQGLLVEIGNLKRFQTFVPNQDKNKIYLNKKLGEISTVEEFYKFTYDSILRKAKTIDVSWFNIRKMPYALFEIEYSTTIQNSLLKFLEIQDFSVKFYIVADEVRKREFEEKVSLNAFVPIQKRTQFLSYLHLSEWHTKTHEITRLEENLNF